MSFLTFFLFVLVGFSLAQNPNIHVEQSGSSHTIQKETPGNVVVKEFMIDSAPEEVIWADSKNKLVFARSTSGTVYRSNDNGNTWKYQMENMKGSLVAGSSTPGGIAEVVVSEANRNYIFFRGYGDTHWITTDGGLSYESVGPYQLKQIILHKRVPQWVLSSRWSSGCQELEKTNCNVQAYISYDFGKSWRLLASYVAQFGFGRPHIDQEIFMVMFEKQNSGNQKFGSWDKDADLFRSDDLWQTYKKVIPNGNRFLILGNYLFVAKVSPESQNEVQLVVGREDKLIYEIGRLPFELKEHSYTILEASDGAVFLHVNHGDLSTPYGNIYLSDADGWRYSLSLRNNRRDVRGKCDFEKVQGLEGIYIANYIENAEFLGQRTTKEHVVTVMTFDKGGKWAKIKAPTHDSTGKETDCEIDEGCSLHLHGVTDEWSPFYSSKNALGLILAAGNIGKFLDLSHGGTVNTYLSRDAGRSWTEIRKGSHIYEFGDHGGLLVLAKDREPTNEVIFSWDEGITWKSLPLPGLTNVNNIVSEPNTTSLSFLVYGTRENVGVVIHLDFTNLHVRQCEGIEAAGKQQSSYEIWSPTDSNSKCLLGKQVRYTRRKRAEECFNGDNYERKQFVTNCVCTEEDYECDYGFERTDLSGPCVAVKSINNDVPQVCPPTGEYTISKGYRKVAGDVCDPVNGIDLLPTVVTCGSIFSPSSFSWIKLLFLLALGGVVYFGYKYVQENPEFIDDWKVYLDSKRKYHEIGVEPETFSGDEFDIEESLDDTNQMFSNNDFGNTGDSFGPIPPAASHHDTHVPTLEPPPSFEPPPNFTSNTNTNTNEDLQFSNFQTTEIPL